MRVCVMTGPDQRPGCDVVVKEVKDKAILASASATIERDI